MKENIEYLDDIFVTYNLKEDDKKKKHYGVIAQDIEKTDPDMVVQAGEHKSVEYTEVLIKEMVKMKKQMQELMDEIKQLKDGNTSK